MMALIFRVGFIEPFLTINGGAGKASAECEPWWEIIDQVADAASKDLLLISDDWKHNLQSGGLLNLPCCIQVQTVVDHQHKAPAVRG